nr:EpsG family protein [uncultured Lachnoclostridium sp.]
MIEYVSIFLIGFLCTYLFKNKKIIIFWFAIAWWFLLAFRNLHMSLYDTLGTYLRLFHGLQFGYNDGLSSSNLLTSSILFVDFTKIIQLFSSNYHFFIAAVSLAPIIAIVYVISKYLDQPQDVFIACIVYFSFFYFYSFFLLRQFFALALLAAFALPALLNKQSVKFFLAVAVAGLCHPSAFIFIIAYPICLLFKYNLFFVFVSIGLSVAGLILPDIVFSFIQKVDISGNILVYYQNGVYGAGTGSIPITCVVYIFLCVIYCYLSRKHESNKIVDNLAKLVCIGFIFLGWSGVVVEFYRISFYFLFVAIIFMPYVLNMCVTSSGLPFVRFSGFSWIYIIVSFFLLIYLLKYSSVTTFCNPYVWVWDTSHYFPQWNNVKLVDPGNI